MTNYLGSALVSQVLSFRLAANGAKPAEIEAALFIGLDNTDATNRHVVTAFEDLSPAALKLVRANPIGAELLSVVERWMEANGSEDEWCQQCGCRANECACSGGQS